MLSPVGIHLDMVFYKPEYEDGIFQDFKMSLIMVDGTELPLPDGGGGGHWTEGEKKADVDYYAEFDIPQIPGDAGDYTVTVYFNSKFVTQKAFTITE